MKYLEFPCGCKFPIIAENGNRPYIQIELDVDNHDFLCQATWDKIGSGDTKGVFQLESQLGQQLSKRLKPINIEQLSALTAIMRPGCMESKDENGKSVTDRYIDRKNGLEPVTYYHPALEPSLRKTYGELIYQEEAMQIARDIAGFNLQDADVMRKAIGKKKPEEMAKVKKMFLDGCHKLSIVNDEQAAEIFDGIEKSQRYSFNKSHAVSYGLLAYLTAYYKVHLPHIFFTSYLKHSEGKAKPDEEVKQLVNNAKLLNIDIMTPDIRRKNKHFKLVDDKIYFGIIDIKGIGESVYKKIITTIYEETPIETWTKNDLLFRIAPKFGYTPTQALISAGAFSYIDTNRNLMIYESQKIQELTDKERQYIIDKVELKGISVTKVFEYILSLPVGRGQCISTKTRHAKITGLYNALVKPTHGLEDSAGWIARTEQELLGIPITCSEVDDCDISVANCTCKEFLDGQSANPIIGAKLERIKEITIKNGKSVGQKMAFLSVSDNSCNLDSVTIFSEPYGKYKHLLLEGNMILLAGKRDNKRGGLIVDKIWQLK